MKRKRNWSLWVWSVLTILLITVAGWAFYNLIQEGVTWLLALIGIEGVIVQNLVIIVFVIFFLALTGTSFYKAIDKILGR